MSNTLETATLVPLALIDDAPGQPRRSLPDVEELASNIETYGLLQPVAVRRVGGRYQVLSGHRRVAALRLLRDRRPSDPQWSAIAAVVTRVDDDTAHLSMISSQVHASAWTPSEECAVLQRLVACGRKQRDIAELLNRSESWVSLRLAIYADEALAEHVKTNVLPLATAEALLTVRDHEQRRELASRAAREGWSRRQARREARRGSELRIAVKQVLQLLQGVDRAEIPAAVWRDIKALQARLDEMGIGNRLAA